MRTLACEVLGVDWTVNLATARALLNGGDGYAAQSLQGNLDPAVLFASPEIIDAEVLRTLRAFGAPDQTAAPSCQHIFNLGHGIHQDSPPEHVAALVEAVHRHSRRLRHANGQNFTRLG